MDLKYGKVSDEDTQKYIGQLVNGVFKILPLKEENADTLQDYIESLQREMMGFSLLYREPRLLKIISTLEYLAREEYDHAVCKREVFKCIHILDNISDQYKESCEGHE